MKTAQIMKMITENVSFTTGRFQEFSEETSKKNEKYGKVKINIGSGMADFLIFAPKVAPGAAAAPLKPEWAKEYGTPVVIVGYHAVPEGRFIRHNFKSIDRIEP